MRSKPFFGIWALLGFAFWSHARQDGDRIWISGKINDKPAQMVFDTGSEGPILTSAAAKRFGLKRMPSEVFLLSAVRPLDQTEEVTFSVWETKITTRFILLDIPDQLQEDFDGFVGWPLVRNNILQIDANLGFLMAFPRLPTRVSTWMPIPLWTNVDSLWFAAAQGNNTNLVAVDTGDPYGVALPPAKWREWKATHPKQLVTMSAYFTPTVGMALKEEAWADELSMGPLMLNGVPVTEAVSTQVALGGTNFAACLGMAALKRLDLIVDIPGGMAYLHPKTSQPGRYNHNRLGAVFVPPDLKGERLFAHVAQGSPADKAGIRNGDELLRVGGKEVSMLNVDRFKLTGHGQFNDPPGTRIELTLKRGRKIFKTTATLQDIVAPIQAK
jgi:hypothetical protein